MHRLRSQERNTFPGRESKPALPTVVDNEKQRSRNGHQALELGKNPAAADTNRTGQGTLNSGRKAPRDTRAGAGMRAAGEAAWTPASLTTVPESLLGFQLRLPAGAQPGQQQVKGQGPGSLLPSQETWMPPAIAGI